MQINSMTIVDGLKHFDICDIQRVNGQRVC
jgi:hypothetical protein